MTECPPVLPPTTAVAGLATVERGLADAPRLQRFFDENPACFLAVQGEPAGPAAAHEELVGLPPAGRAFTKKWGIGHVGADGRLAAMAEVITDLLATGVWHIGLFIVATARHGGGEARALVAELEAWARASGADWLRPGVVEGNGARRAFPGLGRVRAHAHAWRLSDGVAHERDLHDGQAAERRPPGALPRIRGARPARPGRMTRPRAVRR